MIGTKLAHYEITAHLGSGGMGDVYQATDLKLKRSVAIKLLPAEFASDAESLSRFRREAQLLASLNHPNIAHIYGLEESGDKRCIVMELVEGETLQSRLKKGPISVDEALAIAKQICEALEGAHEKGVIHRDLKPGNVMLTGDGKVKVLDFGLAKAMESDVPNADLSNSPTMMSGASIQGVILGTAAYMSPEQARGRKVDRRSDIFAFGCVLFEMLSGKRAFDGEDITEILGRVVTAQPDWTLLPLIVPPRIKELLQLCLEKNMKNRRQDARDVLIDIEQALRESGDAGAPSVTSSRASRFAWIVASVFAITAIAAAVIAFRPATENAEVRLDIATPVTSAPLQFALSPDGKSIVFVATGDGASRLWLRRLDQDDAQPMAGTERAQFPFWSPNSKSIGFFADNKLKRIEVAGGAPIVLTDAVATPGGAWSVGDVILFHHETVGRFGFERINASGGSAANATVGQLQRAALTYSPYFLPDGRHFLFYATGAPEIQGVYLGGLDGSTSKKLAPADSGGVWLPPDRVLYVQQGRLVARRLDLGRGEFIGDPETVANAVGGTGVNVTGGFSASANGFIAYRSGDFESSQLVWLDRSGRPAGKPLESNNYIAFELSPEGKRVAVDRNVQGNRDVWINDVVRGGLTRFTFDPAQDGFPVWSPDGTQIAFESGRKGDFQIYTKPSNGAGQEQLLLDLPGGQWPEDYSRDGKFLLYYNRSNSGDLYALPLTDNERKPIAVATTPFPERTGAFSPDGRWVAYDTAESGRFEVVVQAFPNPTGKWQVSTGGGAYPRWSADGKELYFIAGDNLLMASAVHPLSASLDAGTPVPLFTVDIDTSRGGGFRPQYSVSPDGRFLVNQVTAAASAPIKLILNWKPKVDK